MNQKIDNRPRVCIVGNPCDCPYRVTYTKDLESVIYGEECIAICGHPDYLKTCGTFPACQQTKPCGVIDGFPEYCPLKIVKD